MLRPRIIPCLLVHRGGLVKTQAFKEPKYVGDPINAVKIFNEKEADELIVLDSGSTDDTGSRMRISSRKLGGKAIASPYSFPVGKENN